MHAPPLLDIVQVVLWFVAGAVSLYFSIGSDRFWTSISTGFFLIFISQGYTVAPWVESPRPAALHAIIGTIAIMVMTYGFQAYYVFSRTLEADGSKLVVYLTTAGVIAASAVFLWSNPEPSPVVLRHIRLIENSNWVFLSLINLDMIRRIYSEIRDTPIARGLIAFGVVFALIFVWRGAELYLQVYAWDSSWSRLAATLNTQLDSANLARIAFSGWVQRVAGVAASVGVAGTFVYLYRLLA